MGASASKVSKTRNGVYVTLDALGTLYKFREPVSTQYIKVARRCGLRASIEENDLDKAFRKSFKEVSAEFPNYGKDQLSSPRAWWKTVVNDAFRQVVDESRIPDQLGDKMYDHFTSRAAYELYPDVKPFLANMRRLKQTWSHPDDPPILIGVISNSDPRVKNVLQSLGIKVGADEFSKPEDTPFRSVWQTRYIPGMDSPWYNLYDSSNEIDFLVTSYRVGREKPHSDIFQYAQKCAEKVSPSRLEQQVEDQSVSLKNARHRLELFMQTERASQCEWIHIGDEYKKDYLGAKDAGFEAIHLVREGEGQEVVEGVTTVSDLGEAAAAIRILMAANMEEKRVNA